MRTAVRRLGGSSFALTRRDRFLAQTLPPCPALMPSDVIEADFERAYMKLRFAEQPAFENHFGNIAGGFAVALIDDLTSVAAFAKTRQWCHTIKIHSGFSGPAKIRVCEEEAWVVKGGEVLVIVEANLWGSDGRHALHATAIAASRGT